ncbi:MAG: hypothetical protein U9P10_02515 [Thermodesulfobacteriota bacterium]|nr:hypothetical protein [Thermodesulfobacteriota bacterium]
MVAASVMEKLAQIRNKTSENLSETLWDNTCRLYRIKQTDKGFDPPKKNRIYAV